MAQLTSEGLLFGAPGRGRHVRDVPRKLTCAGIYERADVVSAKESVSTRVLLDELRRELGQSDVETRIFVESRDADTFNATPLPDLAAACAAGEVQGVIVVSTTWQLLEWMPSLGVPFTAHAHGQRDCSVEDDAKQAITLALTDLARRGCRSFGVLSVQSPDKEGEPSDPCYELTDFYDHLLDVAAGLNLTVREEWLVSTRPEDVRLGAREQFGYDRFKHLWRSGRHPDGLYVPDDVIARGVLLAMAECGVRVPEDLQLVLFRCREIGLLCPFPASFVELSLREDARALVAHLQRQVAGHPPQRTVLEYRLVPAEDTVRT